MSIIGLDAAARDYVVASSAAQALMLQNSLTPNVKPDLGRDVDQYGNPDMSKPFNDGWVFRATRDNIPHRNPEGTGQATITFTMYDSWATSSYHTSRFPNLLMSIHADLDRDLMGNPIGTPTSSKDRALRVYEAIDPLFDDVANRIHSFGVFPIISTIAGGGFYIDDVTGGDGLVRLDQIYNIATF